MAASPSKAGKTQEHYGHGQVIEYIADRIYIAAYTHAPTESTPWPYSRHSRSPNKRSRAAPQDQPGSDAEKPVYYTIDDILLYNRFHADFGPLHIGHLYHYASQLHDILSQNATRPVVMWSKNDAKSRANAACILACYMVLIQHWPPHLALAPISQVNPPFMPFRDAGYSQADYGLTIQDVVYGVWKAREEGLIDIGSFQLEEYERFERVDQGDFNWITPHFLAFASPQHKPVAPIAKGTAEWDALPKNIDQVQNFKALPEPFRNVLCHFKERGIGLVVRLNDELYSPSFFTALGIQHIDMIFDDGTCPSMKMVKRFISLAHDTITRRKKGIAVHCKAGLGRTGCLIGAYLIYRHGFTANELIAFMRFMRPGMVVGPQQHWLHIHQGTFRQWWWEDLYKEKYAQKLPSTPTKTTKSVVDATETYATPPNGRKRTYLGEIDDNSRTMDENLPAPTPGQPRKTSRMQSPIRAGQRSSASQIKQEDSVQPTTEVVEVHRHRQSQNQDGLPQREEEWEVSRTTRKTSSPLPIGGTDATRSVSYTATNSITTKVTYPASGDAECGKIDAGDMSDVENWGEDIRRAIEGGTGLTTKGTSMSRVVTPSRTKAAGRPLGLKVRASPERRNTDSMGAIRKASSRHPSGSVRVKA